MPYQINVENLPKDVREVHVEGVTVEFWFCGQAFMVVAGGMITIDEPGRVANLLLTEADARLYANNRTSFKVYSEEVLSAFREKALLR